MRNLIYLSLIILLFACDVKPIDYSKKVHKSSYAKSYSTQTGQLRRAHPRKSVSTSPRAFMNRINSRSYYYRHKSRKRLRKGD